MSRDCRSEKGFTLIEVLASITILSIASLVLMSYFMNALSSAKHNQSQTVMVHLARNVLFYVEKQDFQKLNKFFVDDHHTVISSDQCTREVDTPEVLDCHELFEDSSVLKDILNPVVNGINYQVSIEFQDDLYNGLKTEEVKDLLLPIMITVRGPGDPGGRNEAKVEGYVTDEKIR
ncbi:prepilin-type N-terminal cleavage/methylation domain-containing protein [Paenibacillus sp. DS2015]|uniref:type IV pilus modification PilV family protein n=1 Tax=Paenibacillus sp. DS2015 TaxID=3373917 RepID=UPI003D1ADCF7